MIALFFLMACGEKTTTDNSLLDEDNDGVVASCDCNDSDPSLLEMKNDSDCDGFINEEDCGPDDASICPALQMSGMTGLIPIVRIIQILIKILMVRTV